MDSMRSLNTSLPKARAPRPAGQQDVHQSFRTAALTVTNLYKSALADIERSRADGYQDALEDLIGFLDRDNLGVGEGEGWRIRQWAMERLDGALPGHGNGNSDSDDDVTEDKRARSSSPALERNPSLEHVRTSEPPQPESTLRSDSAPPIQAELHSTDADMMPPQTIFHFASPHSYPSNYSPDAVAQDFSAAARRAFPPRRTSSRAHARNLQRNAASNLFSLGNGAGQKRKLMDEFFNVDGINDRRDRGGGPKRGRLG